MSRFLRASAWTTAGALALAFATTTTGPAAAAAAPLLAAGAAGAIPGHYIVVLDRGARAADARAARDRARSDGGRILHAYSHALTGFAAVLSPDALAALRRDPQVAYVEQDAVFTADTTQSPVPSWGLDRIDQRTLPLSNSYTYTASGAGVKAYIIDTGITTGHVEFGGRAVDGYDAIDGALPAADCNGHGTHVAGTVGGSTYGVAKSVQLVAVRVLNCQGSGSTSQVVAGIDWATADHAAGQPAVANMSLGGGASAAMDAAVANSINDGITYAIAAGNGNAFGTAVDACTQSPARVAAAVTVSATDSADHKPAWANRGTCVDVFAPGVSITSAWGTSTTATNTISGTSMATPHVTGVAATYLQGNPSASPATVAGAIVASATTGVVVNAGTGSPNRLLYSPLGATPPPPPPPPTSCASLPEVHTGSLSGAGDADNQPNGTFYYAVAGTHQGCLDGPAGADFDLYLYRWNGLGWSRVASGIGTTADESVTYAGTAGYYYWRVVSYTGSGAYTLGMKRP
jgi:subtilisin family serine protease